RSAKGTPVQNSPLLDEREVAAHLKVSVSTLRNWRVARRGPPFVKVGARAVRYRLLDVQIFIEAGVRDAKAAA
ncbi:phage transcriptional regulator, AlpA, partial [mine drainage metagenome]